MPGKASKQKNQRFRWFFCEPCDYNSTQGLNSLSRVTTFFKTFLAGFALADACIIAKLSNRRHNSAGMKRFSQDFRIRINSSWTASYGVSAAIPALATTTHFITSMDIPALSITRSTLLAAPGPSCRVHTSEQKSQNSDRRKFVESHLSPPISSQHGRSKLRHSHYRKN